VVTISDPIDGAVVGGLIDLEISASDAGSGVAEIEVLAGGLAPTGDPSATYDPEVGPVTVNGSEDTTLRPDGTLSITACVVCRR